jgi:hypothetical protein
MNESKLTKDEHNDSRLDWHSAFFVALKAELVDYLDVLQFEQEHPLNEQPLRIDAVIIKAPPKTKINKNFAKNFRGHNIFEYKSPEDSLAVSDYIKVIGYACLYQSIESIDYTDITITLVCTMKPEAVLGHLQHDPEGRYDVVVRQPGIYEISGEKFPVQIIESKLLSPEENAWLSSLEKNAERVALEQAVQQNSTIKEKINLSAFWYVVANANIEVIDEVMRMNYALNQERWEKLFDEIGFTQKVKKQGVEEGIDITVAIMKGLKDNIPPSRLSADYGMPLERVEKIRQEVYG